MQTQPNEQTSILENTVDDLRRRRDELALRVHLVRSEVAGEWTALEHKWDQVQDKLARVRRAGNETNEEVVAAMGLLIGELDAGYQRVGDALESPSVAH